MALYFVYKEFLFPCTFFFILPGMCSLPSPVQTRKSKLCYTHSFLDTTFILPFLPSFILFHTPSSSPPCNVTFPSQVLNEKIRELNQGDNSLAKAKMLKKPTRFPVYACSAKHVKSLYSAVRDFRDSEGRQLSEVFLKLPSKALYPDYYEVRRRPL